MPRASTRGYHERAEFLAPGLVVFAKDDVKGEHRCQLQARHFERGSRWSWRAVARADPDLSVPIVLRLLTLFERRADADVGASDGKRQSSGLEQSGS